MFDGHCFQPCESSSHLIGTVLKGKLSECETDFLRESVAVRARS